jgi:hypothetical protein
LTNLSAKDVKDAKIDLSIFLVVANGDHPGLFSDRIGSTAQEIQAFTLPVPRWRSDTLYRNRHPGFFGVFSVFSGK